MKLLIIDDDPIYLIIIDALLSLHTAPVDFLKINNPVEALEILQSDEGNSYDTILLDINMPSINGWEFLDELKRLNIQKKVFIVTSSINLYDFEQSKLYENVVGYFVKPIMKSQITSILNS